MTSAGFRLTATLLLTLIAGCATDITLPSKKNEGKNAGIRFQSLTSSPSGGALTIDESPLLPGDILLSSAASINSLGIRVFSLAPVSHAAIYLGEGQVAEAVGGGVSIISLSTALEHSNSLIAFRYPGLTPEQAARMQSFAISKRGSSYNYKGIVMMTPYMLTKRLCELPLFGGAVRSRCLTLLATLQLGDGEAQETETFFCSQFVLEAYNFAGHPISNSEPAWITPADLLHMRQGDSASFPSYQELEYIGHLKQRRQSEQLAHGEENLLKTLPDSGLGT